MDHRNDELKYDNENKTGFLGELDNIPRMRVMDESEDLTDRSRNVGGSAYRRSTNRAMTQVAPSFAAEPIGFAGLDAGLASKGMSTFVGEPTKQPIQPIFTSLAQPTQTPQKPTQAPQDTLQLGNPADAATRRPAGTPAPKRVTAAIDAQNAIVMRADKSGDWQNVMNSIDKALKNERAHVNLDKKNPYRVRCSFVSESGDACQIDAELVLIPFTEGRWQKDQGESGSEDRLAFTAKQVCSPCSKIAFLDLIQRISHTLYEDGVADVMADGREILIPLSRMSTLEDLDDISDMEDYLSSDFSSEDMDMLDDIPPPPMGLMGMGESSSGFVVSSPEDEILKDWSETLVTTEDYAMRRETLQVVARAAKEESNAKSMAGSPEFVKSVLHCLSTNSKSMDLQIVSSTFQILQKVGRSDASSLLRAGALEPVLGAVEYFTKRSHRNPVVLEMGLSVLHSLLLAEGYLSPAKINEIKAAIDGFSGKLGEDEQCLSEYASLQAGVKKAYGV